MDFADEFPMASVIGIDLSPIQPEWVPPNVKFYVDDVEGDWVEADSIGDKYDFIHGRSMSGSIHDWPRLHRQALQSLKPGGWLELEGYETTIQSDDDPDLVHAPYAKQFQEALNKASRIFGKELNIAGQQKQHMIDAGFVEVHDDVCKVGRLNTLSLLTLVRDPKTASLSPGTRSTIPIIAVA